jgi:hypothetical protein
MASDEAGAWGLRPYMLIADELAAWQTTPPPRRLWEAASSAVAKLADGAHLRVHSDPRDRIRRSVGLECLDLWPNESSRCAS